MDRYELFQRLLTLIADDFEITNAKMKDYADRIVIDANSPDGEICVEVTMKEKEAEDADNT